MKSIVHAIVSLEFTQAVILFVLSACILVADSVLQAFGVTIPIFVSSLFYFYGTLVMLFSVVSLVQGGPVYAYFKARRRINEAFNFQIERERIIGSAIEKCRHVKECSGDDNACPVHIALTEVYKEPHEPRE